MSDPRREIIIIGCIGAALLGLALVMPLTVCEPIIVHGGYWAAMFSVTLTFWTLWRQRSAWPVPCRWAALTLVPVFLLLQLAQPHGWKIEPDEHVIAATARSMTKYHAAIVSAESWKTDSPAPQQAGVVDKRPLGFPAVISLVNGVAGYRPENVFAVNAALCGLLLLLSWHVGRAWAGVWGGVCAVLSWGNLPLAQYVFTSGGNDGFNVVLLLGLSLATKHYFEGPSCERLALVMVVALLQLQARYESAVLALPFMVLVAHHAWRTRGKLPLMAWVMPFLLFPTAVIRRATSVGAWDEEMLQIGAARRFGLEYVIPNVRKAGRFLFSTDGNYPNAPVVAWVVLCLLPLGLAVLWRERSTPRGRSGCALFLAGVASAAVSMGYFWGQWTDPLVSRTSMPFYAGLIPPLLAACSWLHGRRRNWAALVVSALVAGVLLWAVPHSQTDRYLPSSERYSRVIEQMLDRRAGENDLWITSNPMQPVLRGFSAITFQRANGMADALEFSLRHKIYQNVFVAQWYRRTPDGAQIADGMSLTASLALEPVETVSFVPEWELRISTLSPADAAMNGRTAQDAPMLSKGRRAFSDSSPGVSAFALD